MRISAPFRVALETLRRFALTKLGWIKKQQVKLQDRPPRPRATFGDGETHPVWGKPHTLRVTEGRSAAAVRVEDDQLILSVRPGTSTQKREAAVEDWYREQLREAALPLFRKWEPVMGVAVGKLFTQRMRTRWGSCNHRSRNIRLNTELARKSPEYLEYVIVHEMVHLLEPSHNARFKSLMTKFMPDWPAHRQALNRRGVRQDDRAA